MTTTALDIVTKAMRNLNMVELGDVPDATEGAWALTQLNGMATAWAAQGINTGWTDVALEDEFPLDDRHRQGVTYMLMELLSAGPLNARDHAEAVRGYNNLAAEYKKPENLRMDDGLAMPSQGNTGWPSVWAGWW